LHEVLISPGKQIPDTLNVLLDNAKHSIEICVFTISDQSLSKRIVDAHRRGVAVRIISDDQKVNDRGSQVYNLKKAGIKVKIDHSRYHMHHKFGVIDNRISFTGSYNWTYTATKHNQENLIVTTNYDIVKQFGMEFEKLWGEMFWL
jgi:phosphatidylserine/phosphatidylglycerophosphate/cardiolipin synthase-like enzyme